MRPSYQLTEARHNHSVIDLILKGESPDLILTEAPKQSVSHSIFWLKISRTYPETEWVGIKRQGDPHGALVAKIPTKIGLVITWRNGWGHSAYNFKTYAAGQMYHRGNVNETIELIKVLLIEDVDIPLHLNDTLFHKNKTILLNRLRGEPKLTTPSPGK